MNQEKSELLMRALEQRTDGRRHYREARLRDSSLALRRAYRLAEAVGSEGEALEDECRFWLGASLHGEGRLPEALAAWTPSVNRALDGHLTADRYMALTRYLLVAVEVPMPLARIQAAFVEVRDRLGKRVDGLGACRSRLLLAQGKLALHRGEWRVALETLQEALADRRRESVSYTYSKYFRLLAHASMRVGELDLMQQYLNEWESFRDEYLRTKRLMLSVWKANHRLALGDSPGAFELIGPMQAEIASCHDVENQAEAGRTMVRACMQTGMPERARGTLALLARLRKCAIGGVRFEAKLTLADFHLFSLSDSDVARTSRSPNVLRARRAIAAARKEARKLDRLLQCERHSMEAGKRARSLDH